ncbi:MAG: hypothetical protein KIT25_06125 [Enhydrobacter sp.]|nr:MAG: hypothetical protein KIT25_06125 [Enhydrobacter sp.]
MAIQYFAKVTAADHETFQRIVKHYPLSSYADWHLKETARAAEWRGRRHSVQFVKITPKEFTDHCERTGAPRDIVTFKALVCAKGGG